MQGTTTTTTTKTINYSIQNTKQNYGTLGWPGCTNYKVKGTSSEILGSTPKRERTSYTMEKSDDFRNCLPRLVVSESVTQKH